MEIKKDIVKATEELARIVKDKSLSYIRVKDGEVEIEVGMPEPVAPVMAPVHAAPVIQAVSAAVPAAPEAAAAAPVSGNFIKSPIVGTFYAAPAQGKPPFVKVGDKIEKGAVVCIIESMKLMNEIHSEYGGTVAEIYMNDAEAVEFDQKLMRIE